MIANPNIVCNNCESEFLSQILQPHLTYAIIAKSTWEMSRHFSFSILSATKLYPEKISSIKRGEKKAVQTGPAAAGWQCFNKRLHSSITHLQPLKQRYCYLCLTGRVRRWCLALTRSSLRFPPTDHGAAILYVLFFLSLKLARSNHNIVIAGDMKMHQLPCVCACSQRLYRSYLSALRQIHFYILQQIFHM